MFAEQSSTTCENGLENTLASRRSEKPRRPSGRDLLQPTALLELSLYDLGRRSVVGVDEVGRGALAGPVVAAACQIPVDLLLSDSLDGLRDSKQLTDAGRRRIERVIKAHCDVACGAMPPELIDRIGIAGATRLAMAAAVDQLSPEPDCVLVDYFPLTCGRWPTFGVVGGDAICASVAAASVVAKVFRDNLMIQESSRWPAYHFAENKGYATSRHLAAIAEAGPCPIHRRSFLTKILCRLP